MKFLGNPLDIPAAVTGTEAVRKSYVDAIGTRVTTLEGNTGSSGLRPTVVKTAAYTAAANDLVLCSAASGTFTVTLPTSPAANTAIGVKKVDASANIITVAPGSGTTIDGDSSLTLESVNVAALVVYDSTNSNWRIFSTATFDAASSMLFRGTYDSATTYKPNDVVSYLGGSYVALVSATGTAPTAGASSSTWGLMVPGSPQAFATAAARDNSFGAAPPAGSTCFMTDTNCKWSWVTVGGAGCWVPEVGTTIIQVQANTNKTALAQSTYVPVKFDQFSVNSTKFNTVQGAGAAANYNNTTVFTPGASGDSKIYLPFPGLYELSGAVSYESGAAGARNTGWQLSGSTLTTYGTNRNVFTTTGAVSYSARTIIVPISLALISNLSNYVELIAYQSGQTTLNTDISTQVLSYASVRYLGVGTLAA